MAAYSDADLPKGMWVEIEVFPRDGTSIAFIASIVHATPLPSAFPARFDVVFEIKTIEAEAAANLAAVLI